MECYRIRVRGVVSNSIPISGVRDSDSGVRGSDRDVRDRDIIAGVKYGDKYYE